MKHFASSELILRLITRSPGEEAKTDSFAFDMKSCKTVRVFKQRNLFWDQTTFCHRLICSVAEAMITYSANLIGTRSVFEYSDPGLQKIIVIAAKAIHSIL